MPLRVAEIGTAGEFDDIASEWDELLLDSGQDDSFLTSAWIAVVLEQQLSTGSRIAIFTCRDDDGRLVGAVPAYVSPPTGRMGARRLRLLCADTIAPNRCGAIVRRGHSQEAVAPLADALLDWDRDWSVVEMTRLNEASPFLRALDDGSTGCVHQLTADRAELGVLDLPDTWDTFMERLSKSMRKTLRRAWRQLEADYDVTIEAITRPDELPQAVEDATAMFASRMTYRYKQEFKPSTRHAEFLMAVCSRCMEVGALRFYFLTVEGQRVSYVIDLAHGDAVFAYKTGFLTEWSEYRVGTLIYSHGVQTAIADHYKLYDFGPGRMEHKVRFGAPDVRPLATLRIYAPTGTGRATALEDATVRRFKETAKMFVSEKTKKRLASKREWRELVERWG